MSKKLRTQEEIECVCKKALKDYLETPEFERSLTQLQKKYNIRRQTLSEKFKQWGYQVVNQQNRCRMNENAFDNIHTEEQFYWLGFMYADGNISSVGNRIEVRLSYKDLEHLEKFRKFLNLSTKIKTGVCNGNPFCHLSIRNKHMWNTLYSYGCIPRKSLILTYPNISTLTGENVYHFIRGYVDGDGCLCTYMRRNTMQTRLDLVGTEAFLEKIKEKLQEKGYIKNKTSKNWKNQAYSLTYSNVPSRRIARLLYVHATIYLERKYQKFLEFCRIEEESSKRKSSKIDRPCNGNIEVN